MPAPKAQNLQGNALGCDVRGFIRLGLVSTVAMLALGGCSDSLPSLPKMSDINPFAEKQVPIPGKRIPVLGESNRVGADMATADRPVLVSQQIANDSWTQPGGDAGNAPGHLSFSGTARQVWSASIGTGSNKYGKLSATPIIADGKVFTLDAAGQVTAFTVASGSVVWRASLTPEGVTPDKGFGGGLATDGARVYAATGFGAVVALDIKSGNVVWSRPIGVPIRLSPTVANERVFVISSEGEVVALSTADGSENWRYRGLPERASILSSASPAIEGDVLLAPFPSGELAAVKISTGQGLWTESLSSGRSASALASLADVARPVATGGVTYAAGYGGRLIATSTRNGERVWAANIGGIQQPWVAGDNVFVVDSAGQLAALTRRDGKMVWSAKLPGSTNWSGPVLAGGRLWLASNTGTLASVEPTTGKVVSTQDLGAPVYIAPTVAQGRMFILTDKARLIVLQ